MRASILCAITAALAGLCMPIPSAAQTQPPPRAADVPAEAEIFGWIEQIVAQGVRRAGHPANLWVEDFAAQRFRDWGLQDVRKDPLPTTAWHEGRTELRLVGGGRTTELSAYPVAWVNSPAAVKAPVVRATAAAAGPSLAGKIVVIDYNLSEDHTLAMMPAAQAIHDPDGNLGETRHVAGILGRSRSAALVDRVLDQNPAGLVVVLKNYYDSPFMYGSPALRFSNTAAGRRPPAVVVSPSAGERIDALLAQGPLEANLSLSPRTEQTTTHNVVGVLPGASEHVVQIASHTDSVFLGAHQDAAGIALVLAQAKYWASVPQAQRPFTLRFLLTSGHIQGSRGERLIIGREAQSGDLARTVVNIHLESPAMEYGIGPQRRLVSLNRPEPLRVFTSQAPRLSAAVIDAVKSEDVRRSLILPADVMGGHPRSAAGHFHSAGVPIVSFISVPIYYFGAEDTLDKVNRDALVPITRATIRIVGALKGETPQSLRRASDDLPKADYATVNARFQQAESGSARSTAYRTYIEGFDKNKDDRITGDEETALRAAMRERFYGYR